MGDALLQKTVTTDFLSKKRVANRGIVPQYYVENNHEAIIPKEFFMRVQEEMAKRSNLKTTTGKRRQYSGKFALSNLVSCCHCGGFYQHTHWNIHGRKSVVWRCCHDSKRSIRRWNATPVLLRNRNFRAWLLRRLTRFLPNRTVICLSLRPISKRC